MCHLWCQVTQIQPLLRRKPRKAAVARRVLGELGDNLGGSKPCVVPEQQQTGRKKKKILKKNHMQNCTNWLVLKHRKKFLIFLPFNKLRTHGILASNSSSPTWQTNSSSLGCCTNLLGVTHPQETPHLKRFPKSSDFSTHFDSTELWWRRKTRGNSPLTVVLVLKKTPLLAKILDEIKSQISQKWQILKWAKPWI